MTPQQSPRLQRLRKAGVEFNVFPAPMFYWLDSYPGFMDYLSVHACCARSNERALIFDLRR